MADGAIDRADRGPEIMLVVAAALTDPAGCVLVQRRPAGKQMAGLWEFPGGKVDRGESPRRALVRELDEELGIGIDERELEPISFAEEVVEGGSLLLLLYRARRWSGIPRPLAASDLRWMTPADMIGLAMPPADRPLVETLIRAG